MADLEKPHKGRIIVRDQLDYPGQSYRGQKHLGYAYACKFVDHPMFAGETGHTSLVVKDDRDTPRHVNDGYEIETLNSRYTVVPSNYDEYSRRD